MNRNQTLPAWLGTAALAAGLLATSSAHALLLIERPTGMGPKQIHTFDDSASYDMSSPRVQIGAGYGVDLGVTAMNGALTFGATAGSWGLGSNGEWTSAKTFVGVDGGVSGGNVASLVFDFGGKGVRGVGARLNYLPDVLTDSGVPVPLIIAAYDRKGNLLENYAVPVSTPDRIDRGVFYGILRDKPSIGSFHVIAPYAVVDDLKFTAPVPEPGTYAMLLAGLGAVAWVARRRRIG
jgi:hypothetical protein